MLKELSLSDNRTCSDLAVALYLQNWTDDQLKVIELTETTTLSSICLVTTSLVSFLGGSLVCRLRLNPYR